MGLLLLIAGWACSASATSSKASLSQPPSRIVSLVPAVTEIIAALKADQNLVGITYHTTRPARLQGCALVGGFMTPSLKRIKALQPDLVFVSTMHKDLRKSLVASGFRVVEVVTSSLANAYKNIELVGGIVGKHQEALKLVAGLRQQLALIKLKVDRIPQTERRRVMRLIQCEELLLPGDDSFQNELIAAAGGIPPIWGKNGVVITGDEEAIRAFNPQIIYADDASQVNVRKLFTQPAWADIVAVKSGNLRFFPEVLTCRAATHIGDFVAWLAATIYPDYFSRPENMVLPETVTARRALALEIEYVKRAEVVELTLADFSHRTLVVDLVEPMLVLSTLEGLRPNITTVGNHYLPPASWDLVHHIGAKKFEARVGALLQRDSDKTALLFTGADMNNLVQKSLSFKKMQVTALVTAGVSSNAVRMGAEEGRYYELDKAGKSVKPGTINIILLSNMRLTQRAMTRALISACEGKSAALQDLDIRSSSNPAFLQATGTGTDNVLVVEGRGPLIESTGGHSKMGELIASAVYAGVVEAVRRQNGISGKRSIFKRLQERRVTIYEFLKACRVGKGVSIPSLLAPVEELLLEPQYIAFVENSLALSNAWQRDQINSLEIYRECCLQVANKIAGRSLKVMPAIYWGPDLPKPLSLALETLVYGTANRLQAGIE